MEKKKKFHESDGKSSIRVVSGGVVLNKKGEIFLARGKKFEGKYIVPGGGVRLGESIEDGAKREILEETGMQVEMVDMLGFSDFRDEIGHYEGKHFLLCDYIFQWNGSDDAVKLNGEYTGEYGWYSVEDALELDLGGNVEKAIMRYRDYIEQKSAIDNWKRAVAEFENYKKSKMNLERDMAGRAVEDFAYRLLPVVDNFHASTDHIPDDQKESGWVQGIMYIQKQLEQVLQEMGIEEIEVGEGEAFDPRVHEAVAETHDKRRVTDDEGDGGKDDVEKVKQVLLKGYRRGERVIRPARVTVI